MEIRISARGLRMAFNRRTIFAGIDFSVSHGETLLVAGRNGSGKSTLVKILCGLLTPTGGKVEMVGKGPLDEHARRGCIGLVAPYLQVYDEFSALENMRLTTALRGLPSDDSVHRSLLERVALDVRRTDPVRGFSSGMKQRLKYALALSHRPAVLVLDEPMANLDADGITVVRALMEEQRGRGILVVATNDLSDVTTVHARVDLNDTL
jgi:heme exporter protein A